ncbi:MAG TPA: FAD-dependent oxidoreductase [Pyrinomonadaceae bacterium]
MAKTRVTILGGGPAGLGAAWRLAEEKKADVVLLEQANTVGGNAGSFEIAGIPVDYGSHRLHPACDPRILRDIRDLLSDDLLDRPRHGRIRLLGRWIHFPLKPADLATKLPLAFGAGVAIDSVHKILPRNGNGNGLESFGSVLEKGLGKTICRDFYFPYARKIWGFEPAELSAIQAHRRVSAGSLGKMAKKVMGLVPGLKETGAGRFYYPKNGYGQISQAIADRASALGVQIKLGSAVRRVGTGDTGNVVFETGGISHEIETDHIWSTIPITVLIKSADPAAPADVISASESISYRAMVLIYLVLETDRFTEFDAHYFPEQEVPITRLSEPKNYSAKREPADRTVLCAELPCRLGDQYWSMDDESLGDVVRESLEKCGIPVRSRIEQVVTRRLPHAYPIYKTGYEKYFDVQDRWVDSLDGVLTFGRQGLFAHDNTHHALAMAYGAVDCLSSSGEFDRGKWNRYRREFEKHVVED